MFDAEVVGVVLVALHHDERFFEDGDDADVFSGESAHEVGDGGSAARECDAVPVRDGEAALRGPVPDLNKLVNVFSCHAVNFLCGYP